jgi:hypothetical protein
MSLLRSIKRVGSRIGDGFSDAVVDPLRSTGRSLSEGATDAWNAVSGNAANRDANKALQAGAVKAEGALTSSYNQGQGLLAPYQAGAGQNFTDYQSMLRGGAFTPQYQQYGGPATAGQQFTPQFQGYGGPMQTAGAYTPQYREYGGPMTSSGQFNPQMQSYQGPMSSGNQLPQFQQFQGPSQFQADARPERMAGTTATVNLYQDPGYQFRLNEGLNAVQNRMAGRGLIGSGAELKGLTDYAQGAASQEFGNAYGRMMQDQANRQADFESDRGFGMANFNQNFQNTYGMNRDQNAWNAQNADRGQAMFEGDRAFGLANSQANNANAMGLANFQQGAFEGDRAAGMANAQNLNNYLMNRANFQQSAAEGDRAAGLNQNQFQNNFALQAGQMGLNAFNGDRTFNYGMNQDLNNWNMTNAGNNAALWGGLVGTGFNAANAGAGLASGYGASLADIYTGMGNASAANRMAQYSNNRALVGDFLGLGGTIAGGLMGGR